LNNMERILDTLNVITPRAAKVLFTGSIVLFAVGIYLFRHAYMSGLYNGALSYLLTFYAIWFAGAGVYIAVSGWALLSEKGRTFLSSTENTTPTGGRNIFWYVRLVFSCLGIALATIVLMSTVFLLLLGPVELHKLYATDGLTYLIAFALLWSPFIYKHWGQ